MMAIMISLAWQASCGCVPSRAGVYTEEAPPPSPGTAHRTPNEPLDPFFVFTLFINT